MLGHVVEVAHDGDTGLDTARRFSPDVVICDIDLPGRSDGHAVARELRGFSDALLIALTGYGQEKDRTRAREAGFDLHSTKPVDPQTIAELVGRDRRG
jgi:DNA-binding response OmpR family regulator